MVIARRKNIVTLFYESKINRLPYSKKLADRQDHELPERVASFSGRSWGMVKEESNANKQGNGVKYADGDVLYPRVSRRCLAY